jgi:CheY-like chemotaxis protein
MPLKTILYVEDEQFLMQGLKDGLSNDYRVLTARNSDQALQIITEKNKEIDLILLDIMMPQGKMIIDPNRGRTSGVELVKHLNQTMRLKTPIVCYTVVNEPEILQQLKELRVKEIISKNKPPSYVENVIKKYL